MRKLVASMLLGAFLAAAVFGVLSKVVSAQDPAKVAPEVYKVVLDNDHVRVIDYRMKPGGKEPMHSHPYGVVVYYFSDFKSKTTFPDGRVVEGFTRAGDILWRDPVTHAG